jgi:1-acyl-sn-glycerol-3-phosphate acyltransferase
VRKLYLYLRCGLIWLVSILHFFLLCPLLILFGTIADPRKHDRPQRLFFRNVLRLAGVRFEVRAAPGFDPTRTSLFVSNHVNLFDPFVIYSAIPQFVRGLELESHFKIPAYGWMMKRFGNIPVADNPSPAALKEMYRRSKAALDDGISLIVFAEGGRTRDGRVGPFQNGAFRMAIEFGYPIVPMSITGSFAFNRKGSWMLYPSKIVVYLHDAIETRGLRKSDVDGLRDRVHLIISQTVDDSLRRAASEKQP